MVIYVSQDFHPEESLFFSMNFLTSDTGSIYLRILDGEMNFSSAFFIDRMVATVRDVNITFRHTLMHR